MTSGTRADGPVLVLRPRPEADETARLLAERGRHAIVSPLLRIEPVPDAASDGIPPGTDALILSSARAAPLAPRARAFVVGCRTARAYEARGGTVLAHAPDGATLAKIIAEADLARLLHVCGDEIAFDFATALAPDISVDRRIVYRAVEQPLGPEAHAALRSGRATVLLTSPRIARVLARETTHETAPVRVLAMSENVARAWGGTAEVAARPTMDALLALLDCER